MLKFKFSGRWDSSNYWSHYYVNTYPDGRNSGRLMSRKVANDCREFFVKAYREKINEHGGFTPWARKTYALTTPGTPKKNDFESWNTRFKAQAEKGLYIVNSFEKAHKWPLTKIYPVDAEDTRHTKIPAIFWSGPRKWTTSPYLMSIWSLCVRLGRNKWLPKKLLTLNHENLVRQIATDAIARDNFNDACQVSTIRQWDTFMALYKDLFGDNSRKYHWDKARLIQPANDRPEGIMKLLDGSTGYNALNKKYYALKREKELK